mmetsp:Transcript_98046/g.210307  ORF Transcript_98046/g.210307 Transcript_98046/m.210307 type:complete len:368 (+) Transcript_98046:67-1170(+)
MGSICSTPAGDNSAVEKVDQKSVEPEKEEVKEAMAPTGTESTIKVFGCRGLRNADWTWTGSQSDAYVICTEKADPEKVKAGTVEAKEPKVLKTTKCCPNSLEPIFDEEFPVTFAAGSTLEFTVYDKDPLKPDDVLGRAELKPEEWANGFNGELPLKDAGTNIKAYIKILVKISPKDYPPGPSKQFTIELKTGGRESMGFTADGILGTCLYVSSISETGPVKEHNDKAGVNEQMKVGQYIVAVNGVGDDAKRMREELQKDDLKLLMERPYCFTIAIKRTGPMGVTIGKNKSENGEESLLHTINQIAEGPVLEWNKSNPDKEVKPKDILVAVNGNRAQGDKQMELLKKDGNMQLVFSRLDPVKTLWDWF